MKSGEIRHFSRAMQTRNRLWIERQYEVAVRPYYRIALTTVWLAGAIIAGPSVPAAGQSLEWRHKVTERVKDQCAILQRALPVNRQLSDGAIVQYCGCIGTLMFKTWGRAEFQRVVQEPMPADIAQRLNELGQKCVIDMINSKYGG